MALDFDGQIFGKGVYSPREAARLVGGTSQEVLRWTRGSGPYDPIWRSYYSALEDTTEISFRDLIELRVVRALRSKVSLQSIRFAISLAQDKWGVERPLSTLEFKTDGTEILAASLDGDEEHISLSRKRPGQKVFTALIAQSLRGLEYEDGEVVRWRPSHEKMIVIDPRRLFGSPVVDDFGVSTHTIFNDYKTFGDIEYLSVIYEIPRRAISAAVRYESGLDQMQAANKLPQGDRKAKIFAGAL